MYEDRVDVVCPECGEPQYTLSREDDSMELDLMLPVDEFMVYDGEMCDDCGDLIAREQEEYDRMIEDMENEGG